MTRDAEAVLFIGLGFLVHMSRLQANHEKENQQQEKPLCSSFSSGELNEECEQPHKLPGSIKGRDVGVVFVAGVKDW